MNRNTKNLLILGFTILTCLSFKTFKMSQRAAGDGKSYRFYENKSYQVLDTVSFYLYSRYQNTDKPKGEGMIKKWAYFFSKDALTPIELLTIDNLRKVFPDNHSFYYEIDAHFRNDQELMGFDNYLKCYKIKYLYNLSINK